MAIAQPAEVQLTQVLFLELEDSQLMIHERGILRHFWQDFVLFLVFTVFASIVKILADFFLTPT